MAPNNEQCPHCQAEIDVRASWDYQEEYRLDYPTCGKQVGVEVQSEPVFIVSKLRCIACGRAEAEHGSWHCGKCRELLAG